MGKTTVIIGGVAAGMSCATRLRRLDEDATIIILEQGEHVSFANCGLPYHIGGVIEHREALLLQTPESLKARFNLDVRINHTVTAINKDANTVTYRDDQGREATLAYDHLVIATGAKPFTPPLPGIELAYTLRNVSDMDKIIANIGPDTKNAVILGGGFIGLEMAENLIHRGLNTTIVELAPQILAPLDEEMAGLVHSHLEANGATIITGHGATGITPSHVQLDNGETVAADLVIASIGVRPDSDLAQDAGLSVNERGLILVDDQQRTSQLNIFAAGDAVAKRDLVSNDARFLALAQTANRHGRLIADVIAGHQAHAKPVTGTAIIGLFGLTAAATGWTERLARQAGKAIRVVHSHPASHATYYPGSSQMHLKLVIDAETDQIIGAQGVGEQGVHNRINVLATAMAAGIPASELMDLELAYAPPFSSAKDPVNMLGYVADNLATGMIKTIQWHELAQAQADGIQVVDVREPSEFANGSIPGALNLPLNELRNRHQELDHKVIVHCQVGQRGHTAARLLTQLGHDVVNLDGGYLTWRSGNRS